MGLSNEFKCYSKRPLYTEKELAKVVAYLKQDGFVLSEDHTPVGELFFKKADGSPDSIIICLNSPPIDSGVMIFSSEKGSSLECVWDYAKKRDIAATKNPVLRFLKKMI